MRVVVFIFASLNGLLRVAQVKHFPVDVFGGVLLAGGCSYLVWRFFVQPRLEKHVFNHEEAHDNVSSFKG